jgi:signal transduction histidine kinase
MRISTVRSLGGRIWVEDNEMGGASFKASFKVAVPVRELPINGCKKEYS